MTNIIFFDVAFKYSIRNCFFLVGFLYFTNDSSNLFNFAEYAANNKQSNNKLVDIISYKRKNNKTNKLIKMLFSKIVGVNYQPII
jgi:hypothetical protein